MKITVFIEKQERLPEEVLTLPITEHGVIGNTLYLPSTGLKILVMHIGQICIFCVWQIFILFMQSP